MVLSTKHSYGRERSKYRTCTFSVDRWGPTETCREVTRSYALKLLTLLSIWQLYRLLHDYYRLILSMISQKNYDLSKHNHIIKAMISTNINLGWLSLMKDCDCNYSNHTTGNLERVGWGQSQNPQLAIVSASLNWINVFRSLLFCHALLQPFPLSKSSLAEMKIWLSQIIVRKLKLFFFYWTVSIKSFHLMKNEMPR